MGTPAIAPQFEIEAPSAAQFEIEAPAQSAGSRFGTNFLSGLGITSNEQAKNFFRHPLNTFISSLEAQGELAKKARDSYDKGDYVGALQHGLNYLVPFLGQQTDQAGEQLKEGDIAGGVGRTLGAATPLIAGSPETRAAASSAVGKLRPTPPRPTPPPLGAALGTIPLSALDEGAPNPVTQSAPLGKIPLGQLSAPVNMPTAASRAAADAAFARNFPIENFRSGMPANLESLWQQSAGFEQPVEDIGTKVRAANPEPTRAEVAAAGKRTPAWTGNLEEKLAGNIKRLQTGQKAAATRAANRAAQAPPDDLVDILTKSLNQVKGLR